MKIFFSGIGGIGTSALAQWYSHQGHDVSGSDRQSTEIWPILSQQGITLTTDQTASNITPDLDRVIYSEAVPPTQAERAQARTLGVEQRSYFEVLGEISQQSPTLAVTGTHGKTSTVSLLGTALGHLGADPRVLVGARVRDFNGRNFRPGNGHWTLLEACEYRANFRHLHPEVVLLTNVEHDHPDAFPTMADYEAAFVSFLSQTQQVYYHAADTHAARLVTRSGATPRPVSALPRPITLQVPGAHYRANATLAHAWLHDQGYPDDTIRQALHQWQGSARRLERKPDYLGRIIYSDYGHHPTEITATLQALGEAHPEVPIHLIYEPHQHARTRALWQDFVAVLRPVSHLALCPIYAARDTPTDQQSIRIESLQRDIGHGTVVRSAADLSTWAESVPQGHIILCMGAGQIDSLSQAAFAVSR